MGGEFSTKADAFMAVSAGVRKGLDKVAELYVESWLTRPYVCMDAVTRHHIAQTLERRIARFSS